MGDFYKITELLGGDEDTLSLAQEIDSKLILLESQIDSMARRSLSAGSGNHNIDMKSYTARTKAIESNTYAIRELTQGLLSIEGIMKRSSMF